MKCPVCETDMLLQSESISNDGKGEEYDRKIYMCKIDDTWVTVEIPRKNLV